MSVIKTPKFDSDFIKQYLYKNNTKIVKSGLYVISPNIQGVYKFGKSKDILSRLDSYCTTYPTGFKIYAIIFMRSNQIDKQENELKSILLKNKGELVKISCSLRTQDTEWVKFDSSNILKQSVEKYKDIAPSNVEIHIFSANKTVFDSISEPESKSKKRKLELMI